MPIAILYFTDLKLIFIYIVPVISSQEIGVLFNNTIILDNSTITWNSFNNEISCFPQTTTNFDQILITTVTTEQVRKRYKKNDTMDFYSINRIKSVYQRH
jgi:hypothetical protein